MNNRKPALIIIPGAWQKTAALGEFVDTLQSAGYYAKAAILPSVGSTSDPLPGLTEDVAAVRQMVSEVLNDHSEIILLCHSYGGLVGSNAVEGLDVKSRSKQGLSGGITQILYMSAFIIPCGSNLFDLMGGQPAPWMYIEQDKVFTNRELVAEIAFNDLSPELAEKFSQQLTYTSASVFVTPSSFEPWFNGIPCSYIFTTEDKAIPHSLQVLMARQLGPEAKHVSLKAGHCPFLSIPDQVIENIKNLSMGGEADTKV